MGAERHEEGDFIYCRHHMSIHFCFLPLFLSHLHAPPLPALTCTAWDSRQRKDAPPTTTSPTATRRVWARVGAWPSVLLAAVCCGMLSQGPMHPPSVRMAAGQVSCTQLPPTFPETAPAWGGVRW